MSAMTNGPPGKGGGGVEPAAQLRNLNSGEGIATAEFAQAGAWKCRHAIVLVEFMPPGFIHHAKETCERCGFVRWALKIETLQRQHSQALLAARLLMQEGLSHWERSFLESVSVEGKLSPRRAAVLERIATNNKQQTKQEKEKTMTREDVFGEKEEKWWIRPPDLKEGGTTLTIAGVDKTAFGKNREAKAVVRFNEVKKKLILNGTQFDKIEELTGQEDTDDWTGTRIRLCPITVEIKENGITKTVDTIAVKPADSAPKPLPKLFRKPVPAAAPTGIQTDDDGQEIPF